MKKANTRQLYKLQRLIETIVRKIINEEYNPIDTVMRDSDELDSIKSNIKLK